MNPPYKNKSTVEEIRERFDADVERFTNAETGQSATMDARLAMELITQAAVASTVPIQKVLDLGCGAGNNTLKLREALGNDFDVDLLDLSAPMVDRAVCRVGKVNQGQITPRVGDFRTVEIEDSCYDVILAAAVLHHLREDADWEHAFGKLHRILRPGGSLWITDLVTHEIPRIDEMMTARYGSYLEGVGGREYRERVFEYIEKEDSPRPITWQLDLLRKVGFTKVEILHKNSVFAAFGAMK